MEKQQLPLVEPNGTPDAVKQTRKCSKLLKFSIALVIIGLVIFKVDDLIEFPMSELKGFSSSFGCHSSGKITNGDDSLCPISEKYVPENYDDIKKTVDIILHDEQFRNGSAEKLGNAVKIPTEIQDGWRDVDSDHFKPFAEFHEYLAKTFPKVHSTLKVEKVNKYGLVYTWEGSEPSLKPILLTAHQDVVPVEWKTAHKWSYHPFSGHYDGKRVWGRGSSDCKDLLIGLLESIELLVESKFEPKRTIILAFGYDEEAAGFGAKHIGDFLLDRYGHNSFYAVIDEGSEGISKQEDVYLGIIATGEKGYVDNIITLTTPGGHSSVPPDHTSIGIISEVVSNVENTPFDPILSNVNPFFGYLQCLATHSSSLDKDYKKAILRSGVDSRANAKVVDILHSDISTRYYIKTSQATDIINGGVKSNALPESVQVLINTRISIDSNVKETTDKITENILKVADKFDLGLIREGQVIKPATDNGVFNYTFGDPLEVAPVTPWSGDVWNVFTGSLRHFYEDVAYPEVIDRPVVFSPGISTGNTDTKSYWGLTNNIYRYAPNMLVTGKPEDRHIHSVDEFAHVDGHLNIVAFYYIYLRNINHQSDFDHE